MPPGEQVTVDGPSGFFILPEAIDEPLIFLAGGIGVTPFHSMMHFVAENQLPYTISLHYSFKTPEQAAFLTELKAIANAHENVSLHPHQGRFDRDYLQHSLDEKALYYVCGPPQMVRSTWETLLSLGVREGRIKTEEFPGYASC